MFLPALSPPKPSQNENRFYFKIKLELKIGKISNSHRNPPLSLLPKSQQLFPLLLIFKKRLGTFLIRKHRFFCSFPRCFSYLVAIGDVFLCGWWFFILFVLYVVFTKERGKFCDAFSFCCISLEVPNTVKDMK